MPILLFGGDLMLGRGVADVISRKGVDYPLAAITPLTRAADRFFANLECAISARQIRYSGAEKAFYFRASPEALEVLTRAGVDVVSLANNHALDADYEGLNDTLDLLGSTGILSAGAGRNLLEASRPARWRDAGREYALLSYCDHQSDFAASEERPGIRFIDLRGGSGRDDLLREIRTEASRCDHLIVAMHWQPNWAPSVERPFRNLAGRIVDAGACIVWGHSPHHFQGVEWMGNSVVLYSTGDLLDDYAVDPTYRNDRQLLFEVVVGEGVEAVRAMPIELSVGQTQPAENEARDWIARRFRSACREVGTTVSAAGAWLEVHPTGND